MPTFIVTAPDGKKIRVTGPEGATQEQAVAIARRQYKAPPQSKAKSFLRQTGRSFANVGAGLAEGAAGVADMFGDVVRQGVVVPALRAVGADETARGVASTNLSRLIRERAPVPADPGAATARALASALGGGATALGAGRALAARGSGEVARYVGATLAEQPGTQLAAAGTSGVAADMARQAGLPVPLQVAAGITAGGLTPAGMNAGYQAGRSLLGQNVREGAARVLQDSADDIGRSVLNLRTAGPQASGALQTTAEASLDPGLAGLQRAIADSGVKSGSSIGRRLIENARLRGTAIDDALGYGDPMALRFGAQADDAALQSSAQRAVANIGDDIPADLLGERVRNALSDAYSGAKARTSEAWRNPVLSQDIPAADAVSKRFGALTETQNRFYGAGGGLMPAPLESIMREIYDTPRPTTEYLQRWDRRLSDIAGNMSMQGMRSDAAAAKAVQEQIRGAMDEAMPLAAREALKAARDVRSAQGATFETGAVGKVLDRGDYGRFALDPARIPGRVVPPGVEGGGAVRQLRAAAPEAVSPTIGAELRRQASEVGPEAVQARYAPVLSEAPDVAARVQTAAESRALADAFRKTPYGRLMSENVDPVSEVARLLNSRDGGNAMARLIGQAKKSPEAMQGIRRALASEIERASTTRGVDESLRPVRGTGPMLDAVSKVMKTAGAALEPEQRRMLNVYRRELRKAQFAATANKTQGSSTVRNASVTARIMRQGAQAVAGSKASTVLDWVMNWASRTDDISSLVADAMLDPKLAADLLKAPTPDRTRMAVDRLTALTEGAVVGAAATAEHP